ncbi:MAG: hypothetical protein AAFN74_25135, partial [Myxococcota bacterium]
ELLISTISRDATGMITGVTMCNHDSSDCRTNEILSYDASNIYPTETRNSEGHEVDQIFDSLLDRRAFAVDVNGLLTAFKYDGFGRPTQVTLADGRWETTKYSALGPDVRSPMKVRSEDSRGIFAERHYNHRGQLKRTQWKGPKGQLLSSSLTYDRRGRLTAVREPFDPLGGEVVHITRFEWDNIDRIRERTRPGDEIATWTYPDLFTTEYTDEVGRRTVSTVDVHRRTATTTQFGTPICPTCSDERTTVYRYGAFGRLASAADPAGNITEIDYDGRGRRSRLDEPNSGRTRLFYTPFDELRERIDHAGSIMTWTHDSLGRPLTRVSDDGTNTFTYDVGAGAIGKLSSATSADGGDDRIRIRPVWTPGGESVEPWWIVP